MSADMLKALLGIEKNLGRIADALEKNNTPTYRELRIPFPGQSEEPLPEGGNGGICFGLGPFGPLGGGGCR